ncbi:hypothetical protein J2X83_005222 [Brevibacillus nitrificans]|nr:hypothetical protein [Brevibacillus nitrificans]
MLLDFKEQRMLQSIVRFSVKFNKWQGRRWNDVGKSKGDNHTAIYQTELYELCVGETYRQCHPLPTDALHKDA